MSATRSTELVKFRLFQMPCCGHLLCWVNPRIPSFCPECGSYVHTDLKSHADQHTLVNDEKAQLKFDAGLVRLPELSGVHECL